jgi:hypothetical protein
VLTWNGVTWSTPIAIDPNPPNGPLRVDGIPFTLTVACPAVTSCVVVDALGNVVFGRSSGS